MRGLLSILPLLLALQAFCQYDKLQNIQYSLYRNDSSGSTNCTSCIEEYIMNEIGYFVLEKCKNDSYYFPYLLTSADLGPATKKHLDHYKTRDFNGKLKLKYTRLNEDGDYQIDPRTGLPIVIEINTIPDPEQVVEIIFHETWSLDSANKLLKEVNFIEIILDLDGSKVRMGTMINTNVPGGKEITLNTQYFVPVKREHQTEYNWYKSTLSPSNKLQIWEVLNRKYPKYQDPNLKYMADSLFLLTHIHSQKCHPDTNSNGEVSFHRYWNKPYYLEIDRLKFNETVTINTDAGIIKRNTISFAPFKEVSKRTWNLQESSRKQAFIRQNCECIHLDGGLLYWVEN